MPRGDKSKYTAKQERKAEHIEQSYEERGVSPKEAAARAWATVNKQSGGAEKAGGSGTRKSPASKSDARKDSARRAVAARKGASPNKGRAASGAKSAGRSGDLDKLRVDELRKRASAKGIPGRSGMRKQQLIDALRAA
jgi:plasmid stabilization system protein ParE